MTFPGQVNSVLFTPGPFVAPGNLPDRALPPDTVGYDPLDFICQALRVEVNKHETNVDTLQYSDDIASVRELSYDATANNIGR